jgi:hypothetical protein
VIFLKTHNSNADEYSAALLGLVEKIKSIKKESLSNFTNPKILFVLKPEITVFVVNDFGLTTLENYQLMASYSIDHKLIDNPDLISIISTMVLEDDKNYDYEKDSCYLKDLISHSLDQFKLKKSINRQFSRSKNYLDYTTFDLDNDLFNAHRLIIELSLIVQASKNQIDTKLEDWYLTSEKTVVEALSKLDQHLRNKINYENFWEIVI